MDGLSGRVRGKPFQKLPGSSAAVIAADPAVPREWPPGHSYRPAPVQGMAAATADQSWAMSLHCQGRRGGGYHIIIAPLYILHVVGVSWLAVTGLNLLPQSTWPGIQVSFRQIINSAYVYIFPLASLLCKHMYFYAYEVKS